MSITQDLVKHLFHYENGVLYWKNPTATKIKKGTVAGRLSKRGYWDININYKKYKNHRVIFLFHHGYLPPIVDHIDGNPLNNKIENLRPATHNENLHNAKLSTRNTSGVKGVSWDKRENKWRATLNVNGVVKRLGRFKDLELAELVITEARLKYHKEFSRCN